MESETQDPRFIPVRTRRSFEEIYDQIHQEIAAGRLRPGDRLPAERDMAAMFSVSRQAVREALRGLETSGLVVSRVGVSGGAFIRGGDPGVLMRSLQDLALVGRLNSASLLEARILITSDAIRLACRRATEEDFAELEADTDDLERLTASGRLDERAQRRIDFYSILGRATHNEVFTLFVESLSGIVRMRLQASAAKPRKDMFEVRRSIVKHLRARDADAAIEVLVAHFNRLEQQLLASESASSRATARTGTRAKKTGGTT